MKKAQKGQALVTLLFFSVIAIMIVSASVSIISTGSISTGNIEQEEVALYIAESGIENALIRLLRNPGYTGETLNIDNGSATVTVTGSNPYTITSVGRNGIIKHTLQASVGYNNNIMTVSSWSTLE